MIKRIEGYDFIRSVAILIVFLGHILQIEDRDGNAWLVIHALSLSSGMAMSLLGFISAVLLSDTEYDYGAFLVRRFTRIFIPLACCLSIMLAAHALLGKKIVTTHVLFHYLGLSAFFDVFGITNKATIGRGLWFITAIMIMYLIFPLLQKLFRHPRGFIHLTMIVIMCTALNYFIYAQSSWNVFVSFSLGVYLSINGKISQLIEKETIVPFIGAAGLIAISILIYYKIIPNEIKYFFYTFYPLFYVPILFMIAKRLPALLLAFSTFFASLSYEFYILHFYFINKEYQDIINFSSSLYAKMLISFLTTLVLACIVSKYASRLRKAANDYLLAVQCQENG